MELKSVLSNCDSMQRKAFIRAIKMSRDSLYEFVGYEPMSKDWQGAHEFEFWIGEVYIMVRLSGTDNVLHLFKCKEVLAFCHQLNIQERL